jgi:hypothetical protein
LLKEVIALIISLALSFVTAPSTSPVLGLVFLSKFTTNGSSRNFVVPSDKTTAFTSKLPDLPDDLKPTSRTTGHS